MDYSTSATIQVAAAAATRVILAAVFGMILLGVSAAVSADDSPFYFDDSGNVQQHGYWSPNSRSRPTYEESRRYQNDQMTRDALRQNEETIKGYHAPSNSQAPSYTDKNPQWLVLPGPGEGLPKLCQRSGNMVYCH